LDLVLHHFDKAPNSRLIRLYVVRTIREHAGVLVLKIYPLLHRCEYLWWFHTLPTLHENVVDDDYPNTWLWLFQEICLLPALVHSFFFNKFIYQPEDRSYCSFKFNI